MIELSKLGMILNDVPGESICKCNGLSSVCNWYLKNEKWLIQHIIFIALFVTEVVFHAQQFQLHFPFH